MSHSRRAAAFTFIEMLVVVAVVSVLMVFLARRLAMERQYGTLSQRISCINNLKVLGTAYRIWANDNGNLFPALAPQTNGGWKELLYQTNANTCVWTNYALMADDLGQSVRILICPEDQRKPANSFSNLANTNISYFVGVNANDDYPQSLLGGDRNMGPGTTSHSDYGFSPANGNGNDVLVNGPVCWSRKMHTRVNSAGAGNILLGDGSAQQTVSSNLYGTWVKNALAEKTARDKLTNTPGLRLIFP